MCVKQLLKLGVCLGERCVGGSSWERSIFSQVKAQITCRRCWHADSDHPAMHRPQFGVVELLTIKLLFPQNGIGGRHGNCSEHGCFEVRAVLVERCTSQ